MAAAHQSTAPAVGSDGAEPLPAGPLTASISNAVVRVYADYTGRGPTKARTHIAPNVITVVLEDTLTRGERRLRDKGHQDAIVETRRRFREAMRADLVVAVEALTSRTVLACLGDHSPDPDVAVQTFVLTPEDDQALPPGRSAMSLDGSGADGSASAH
jgi:uncharacterized protein YbcI